MAQTDETLWQTILFASEIELKGITPLEPNDQSILANHPELHLIALKRKKQNVEYQFSNHKLIMVKYYQDYKNKKITLEEYDELRVDQLAWKTKAASFLSRIEQRISELKACKLNAN